MSLLDILQRRKTERLLWENEDSGLKVQVWEKHDRREMRFGNHIMQSVFSRINANHLVLPYSRFMVLGLIFCPEPKSALHFGLGGGSIPRWLHRHFPDLQQIVIEKNSSVIEAAKRYFEFPVDKRMRVIHGDAEKIIETAINTIEYKTIGLNRKVKDDPEMLTFVEKALVSCNAYAPKVPEKQKSSLSKKNNIKRKFKNDHTGHSH